MNKIIYFLTEVNYYFYLIKSDQATAPERPFRNPEGPFGGEGVKIKVISERINHK
jgi:hypothetical protein